MCCMHHQWSEHAGQLGRWLKPGSCAPFIRYGAHDVLLNHTSMTLIASSRCRFDTRQYLQYNNPVLNLRRSMGQRVPWCAAPRSKTQPGVQTERKISQC
jgi:uncharacterized protein YfaT (DUF1175 family)